MSAMPYLSVIIPTCHRNDLLALCLDQLKPGVQRLDKEYYEVIVTDDGSVSTVEEMILTDYPWATWVQGPRKGPAANRNNGAKYAKGNWLVFTDDDCIPEQGWLQAFADEIVGKQDIEVLEGRTYVNEPRTRLDQVSPINETGGYLWSCNFAILTSYYFSIGGFDERFPYANMEDVDFRYRIEKDEKTISFIKEAAVMHPWRYHGGRKKLIQAEKSLFIYIAIHPESRKKLNSYFFFKKSIRSFVKYTIPGFIKCRGRGITTPILEHISDLKLSVKLISLK